MTTVTEQVELYLQAGGTAETAARQLSCATALLNVHDCLNTEINLAPTIGQVFFFLRALAKTIDHTLAPPPVIHPAGAFTLVALTHAVATASVLAVVPACEMTRRELPPFINVSAHLLDNYASWNGLQLPECVEAFLESPEAAKAMAERDASGATVQ